jgi:sn-glycerol 3-phosphate transport system substrate-binding protein
MKRALAIASLLTVVAGLAATPALAQTKLQFYYPVGVAGPLARIIEGYVKDFNQSHPNVQVEPVFAGSYTESYTKILAAIRGGTPPDTAIMLSQNLNDILQQDIVIPLDEYIQTDAAQVKIDDFFPAFMLNSQQGGKVWSIPFQRSTPVMYYNKDAFKEAGLDPQKPPQSWAEMIAMGQKLTKRDASGRVTRWGLVIPSAGTVDTWLFEGLVIASGGVLYDPNNSCCKVQFNSPAVEASLQLLRDLGTTHKVSPPGPIDWGTSPNDFVAGKTAMMYHSTGSLTFVRTNATFEFGTTFLPKNQRYGAPTGGGNFYLFKATPPDRKKAAWEFIKWMTSPDLLARWSIDSGYVAPRKSSWDTPRMKEYTAKYPQATTARDQLPYALAELPVKNIIEVKRAIVTSYQQALTTTNPLGPIMVEGQKRVDEILK